MMVLMDALKEIFDLKEILKSPIRNKKVILFVSLVFILSLVLLYILVVNIKYFSYLGDIIFQNFQKHVENLKITLNEDNLHIILAIWKIT